MKLVIAMMQHETNTFSPLPTTFEAFGRAIGFDRPPSGRVIHETFAGTDMALGAFLQLAEAEDADVVLPIAAYAEPSGRVVDEAFEAIAEPICAAVAAGCDGVLLDLHGAMVVESFPDAEGELLRRLRGIDPTVPIGVALDFHANVTAAMAEHATVITGYRTYPHIDMHQTGLRCGRILLKAIKGLCRPRTHWAPLPLLSAMLRQTPLHEPMKTPMDMAIAAEDQGRVLAATVFGGFPLSDIPHVCLSSVLVAEANSSEVMSLHREVLEKAWAGREGFVFHPEPLAQTIGKAKALGEGPIVIADYGDNSGAGGQMDDMTVVREILRQGLQDVAVGPIWDPEALELIRAAGLGAEITLQVGGKSDSPAIGLKGRPLELTGRVKTITDGRFVLTGDMMAGFPVNLDGSAVLDCGAIEIIVTGGRSDTYAPEYFTHAGIDPTQKRYVVVKSRQHFRAGFEPIARHVLMAAGKGVCAENFGELAFHHLPRPIYPLDLDCEWSPDSLTDAT